MHIFDVIIFFELRTIQQKTVKPTYLCPLGARKLAEGKRARDCQDEKRRNLEELEKEVVFLLRPRRLCWTQIHLNGATTIQGQHPANMTTLTTFCLKTPLGQHLTVLCINELTAFFQIYHCQEQLLLRIKWATTNEDDTGINQTGLPRCSPWCVRI